MAIPARHIGRVLAHQALRANHGVFQHMVQRMADMHVAIGVRRAVMEDELFAPGAGFAQFLVQLLVLPARQDTRLFLRQPRLHGEVGLRQEDGAFIVGLAIGHDGQGG